MRPEDKAVVNLDSSVRKTDYQCGITDDMLNYNGKIVTITQVSDIKPVTKFKYPAHKLYTIKEDHEYYTWTDAMLQPLPSKTVKPQNNMKSIFKSVIPQKEFFLISIDSIICAPVNGKNIGISKENTLIEYPDEAVFEIPGFIIPTEFAKVKIGDIIKIDNHLAKVLAINKDSLDILNTKGEKLTYAPSVNKLFNKKYVPVVTTLFQNSSEINPMAFMLMDDSKNLLPLLFMQNQGNSFQMDNPMMLAVLMSDDIDASTILMLQMMNNQSK